MILLEFEARPDHMYAGFFRHLPLVLAAADAEIRYRRVIPRIVFAAGSFDDPSPC
jgi:hypothetical protein